MPLVKAREQIQSQIDEIQELSEQVEDSRLRINRRDTTVQELEEKIKDLKANTKNLAEDFQKGQDDWECKISGYFSNAKC